MDKQFVKVAGAWKNGQFSYLKKNNAWVSSVAKYIKRNGQWENIEVSPYGVVWYKTTQDSSVVRGAVLRTQAEFDSLVDSSYMPSVSEYTSWSASVDNGSVTVTNDASNIIVGVTIGSAITSIPDYFLSCCNALSMPIIFPTNIRTIGDNVLNHCYDYNLPVTFSPGLISIGKNFLSGLAGFSAHAVTFNQPIVFPASLTSFPKDFLYSSYFNQPIVIPSTTTALDGFADHWYNFNQTVTIPNSVTSINNSFYSCYKFNKNITIPSSVSSITGFVLTDLYDYTSTVNVGSHSTNIVSSNPNMFYSTTQNAPAYATGIKITGTHVSSWMSKFPNVDGPYEYRKLVQA